MGEALIVRRGGGGGKPEVFGCSKMAIDKIIFSSTQDMSTRLSHSLGVVPKYAFLIAQQEPNTTYAAMYCEMTYTTFPSEFYSIAYLFLGDGKRTFSTSTMKSSSTLPTDSTLQFLTGSYGGTSYYEAGVEYTLITMA